MHFLAVGGQPFWSGTLPIIHFVHTIVIVIIVIIVIVIIVML